MGRKREGDRSRSCIHSNHFAVNLCFCACCLNDAELETMAFGVLRMQLSRHAKESWREWPMQFPPPSFDQTRLCFGLR